MPILNDVPALPADRLHRTCDADSLGFATTAELEPLRGTFGQEDALAALAFGVGMAAPGYNVFVLGRPGSGRATFVRHSLREHAASEPTPPDCCYVQNFRDTRRPCAIALPPGRGPELQADVRALISGLRETLPRAMQAEDAATRRAEVAEEVAKRAAAETDVVRREITGDEHVALVETEDSFSVGPARSHEAIRREALDELPPELRDEIEQHVRNAQYKLSSLGRRMRELHQLANERVIQVNREIAHAEIDHRMRPLREKYAASESLLRHFDDLVQDILEHGELFSGDAEESSRALALVGVNREEFFRRYAVNVIVSNRPSSGAPVIHEANPILNRLLGGVERQLQFGAVTTDFTRITAGALHRANGGYLVLEASDLLTRPLVWPALKRAMQMRELKPTEAGTEMGLFPTESLEPEAIPLDVKLVLLGEPGLYYTLQSVDPEFAELFKVKSDFRPDVVRDPAAERLYAGFVATRCVEDELSPFDAAAVARIIEHASRLAGDQRRLTTCLRDLADLVRESAHWAKCGGDGLVTATDVERALHQRELRNNRPHREVLDLLERGVLAFEPSGTDVGQLYGIGLLSLGDVMFGRPIRVMASAFLGTAGVINIEREVAMSGPIHNKGFLILSGYLGKRFAREHPLILSASLSFDQMYEELEGDSASAAELFTLLSAIGEVPLQQGIAVTGAVNQEGRILPVGGVTQKVEGYYAACERVGLNGQQGVLLPRRNVDNLVVRREVREAVAAGRFHIFAMDSIEEGWPVLAGVAAGARDATGLYAAGSAYRAVQDRLREWATGWRQYGDEIAPQQQMVF